jgi:hypothetical protein
LSILRTSRMGLMERLALHLKHEVALQAEGFDSEPGVVQKIGNRFIRVNKQYFVPHSLQEIVLLGGPGTGKGTPVQLRTTYCGSFQANLIRIGTDFVEVLVNRKEEEEELRILIPLSKVISLENL